MRHFHAIDVARGLAALAVLLWHYQHFYFLVPAQPPHLGPEAFPLYWALAPFYDWGFLAVNFFWLLSGFVFSAVYRPGSATTGAFVNHRIARLYPLHVITLIVAGLLQLVSMRLVGHFQIYPDNDALHFFLNVLFLSDGKSFNGPVWSVSIELTAYALFWTTLPFLRKIGVLGPLTVAAASYVLAFHGPIPGRIFAACNLYFFVGMAVQTVFDRTGRHPLLFGAAAIVAGVAGGIIWHAGRINAATLLILTAGLLAVCGIEQTRGAARAKAFRWIGDNTYGVYLWHIPLTIAALTWLDHVGISRDVARSGWWLTGYIVVVSAVARISYLFIEVPSRRWVRSLRSRPAG